MENIPSNFTSYSYESYMVVMSVNLCLIGSYTSITLLQNVRYMRSLKNRIILLLIAAFSISILAVWSPHFLMINAVKFSNLDIFIDLKMTFTSMGVAIICNTIGFSISFIPFLHQIQDEYETFTKQSRRNYLSTSEVKLSSVENTVHINKLKKGNTFHTTHDRQLANNIVIHNPNNISKEKPTLIFEKFKQIKARMSGRECYLDFEKYDEKNDFNYYEFTSFFKNRKLKSRDYTLIIIGGILLISPSIMILHIIGIKAMLFKGKINFNMNIQIIISFIGLVGMGFLLMSLFLEDNLKNKLIFSVGFSASVIGLHCLSFHILTFYTETGDTTDYSYLFKDTSVVTITQCSKIVLVVNGFLAYAIREISSYFDKCSWKKIKEFHLCIKQNEFPTFLIEGMLVSVLKHKSNESVEVSEKK